MVPWYAARYEHDGEELGCQGKCGIFDMLFPRIVISEEIFKESKCVLEQMLTEGDRKKEMPEEESI